MTETTDGQPPAASTATEHRPVRSGRWIVVGLRVSLVLLMITLFVQVVLAGLFITGDVDMLKAHSENSATGIGTLDLIVLIFAILLRWPGRGPVGPMWVGIALVVLLEVQGGLGYLRLIAWHIPVAVVVIVIGAIFTNWAFRYRHDPAAMDAQRAARKAAKRGGSAEQTAVSAGDAR